MRITLASVEEARGDRDAAEKSLESARSLALHNWNVHYRLGNLLVRQGKLTPAVEEFRLAAAANSKILPGTLDLLWRASRENASILKTVTGDSGKAKLALAQFLLQASHPAEAAAVFSSVDRGTRLS